MISLLKLPPPRRNDSYRCSELARIIGKHPNTLRQYENWGFISEVPRLGNGYRSYSRRHALEGLLVVTALRSNFQEWQGRKLILSLIRHVISEEYDTAYKILERYITLLQEAQRQLDRAKAMTEHRKKEEQGPKREIVGRWNAAKLIGVAPDTLRDWERSGLVQPGRKGNGRRFYTGQDLDRLLLIKMLREGGYSLMGILNLLNGQSSENDLCFARDRWQETLTDLQKDTEFLENILTELTLGSATDFL